MSAAEREQLAALQERAAAEDAEDGELEVWVKNDSGHQIQLRGKRAREFMRKFGIEDEEQEPAGEQEDQDEGGGAPPAAAGGYFRSRRGGEAGS